MPKIDFRLNEFQEIGRWLDKNLPAPISFFLKAWLWRLEDLYIDAKVSAALNEAEAAYRASQAPMVELTEPTRYAHPSEVEGLDTIGYSYGLTKVRTDDKGGLQSLPNTGVEGTGPSPTDESTTGDS